LAPLDSDPSLAPAALPSFLTTASDGSALVSTRSAVLFRVTKRK